ncbi:HEAT repeat domain-containing protein, partial [Planctomycetota bacterium]
MKNLVIITSLCLIFILVLFESSGTTQNEIAQKDLESKTPSPNPSPAWEGNGKRELQARIEQLIKQLGADDWYEREDATRALEEINSPAEPFLKEALKHIDTEIVLRARKILETIAIKKLGKLVFVRNETLWT